MRILKIGDSKRLRKAMATLLVYGGCAFITLLFVVLLYALFRYIGKGKLPAIVASVIITTPVYTAYMLSNCLFLKRMIPDIKTNNFNILLIINLLSVLLGFINLE